MIRQVIDNLLAWYFYLLFFDIFLFFYIKKETYFFIHNIYMISEELLPQKKISTFNNKYLEIVSNLISIAEKYPEELEKNLEIIKNIINSMTNQDNLKSQLLQLWNYLDSELWNVLNLKIRIDTALAVNSNLSLSKNNEAPSPKIRIDTLDWLKKSLNKFEIKIMFLREIKKHLEEKLRSINLEINIPPHKCSRKIYALMREDNVIIEHIKKLLNSLLLLPIDNLELSALDRYELDLLEKEIVYRLEKNDSYKNKLLVMKTKILIQKTTLKI